MLLGTLEQSFIFAVMVLGVYISYKILDFPDMTVDGSFPLGAAVAAASIVKGVNPVLALILAMAAGAGRFHYRNDSCKAESYKSSGWYHCYDRSLQHKFKNNGKI